MTASERILAGLRALLSHFSGLSPLAWMIEIGLTVGVGIVVLMAGRAAKRLAQLGAHHLPGPHDAEKAVRVNHLARLAGWLVQAAAGAAAVLIVADIWSFNLLAWTATPLGARLLRGLRASACC